MPDRRDADDFVSMRPRMTDREIGIMLAMALRRRPLFDRLKASVTPADFVEGHEHYRSLWQAALMFDAQHGELPSEAVVLAGVAELTEGDAYSLSKPQRIELGQLVMRVFRYTDVLIDDPANRKWFPGAVRRYAEERFAAELSRSVRTLDGHGVVQGMPEFLAEASQRAQRFASITAVDPPQLFEEGWDATCDLRLRTTGLSFLDTILQGGFAPGEAYGLLGPYGSCKTTLAVQLWVETARTATLNDSDDRLGLSFYFSYEAPTAELRVRSLSYAAMIHKDSLVNLGANGGLNSLPTGKASQAYEREWFKNREHLPGSMLAERERALEAISWLNKRLVPFDLRGVDSKFAGAGTGYVPELVGLIENTLQQRPGAYCAGVFIDYAGAMAKRYMRAHGKDESVLRHLLAEIPLMARNDIGGRFDCPVWLNHQFAGRMNRRSPTARMHHSEASEASAWAENLDFSFSVGTVTPEGLCKLECTKYRRAPYAPAAVLHVRGEMASVVDVSTQYTLDPYSKQIVKSGDLRRVVAEEGTVASVAFAEDYDDGDDSDDDRDDDEVFDDHVSAESVSGAAPASGVRRSSPRKPRNG